MSQFLVNQDQGSHGLADRDGTDADTGIVAPLGGDIGVFAIGVNLIRRGFE